jgi:hypothetical protein
MKDISIIKIIGLLLVLAPLCLMGYMTGKSVGFYNMIFPTLGIFSAIFGVLLVSTGNIKDLKENLSLFYKKN